MKYFFGNFFNILKTYRMTSLINLAGLSVALTVFFAVLMQVYYDFTYDCGYRNAGEIVQYGYYDRNEGKLHLDINFQKMALIHERVPETETYCMLQHGGKVRFDVDRGGLLPEGYEVAHTRTTSTFGQVFAPEIISGDTVGIFAAPGMAMISEKTARQMFGDEDPVGKTVKYHYGSRTLTVKAVYRDFPENSSLRNGIYTHLPEFSDNEWSFYAYFLVRKENLSAANEKINSKTFWGEEYEKYLEEHPETNIQHRLTSLNGLYLTGAGKGGSKRINTTLSLLATGVLTLLIAFVNFVNLSLAMAPSRVRGINIRRILGLNRTTLRLSITCESVLFTAVSLLIAFAGLYRLGGNAFVREMFTVDLSLKTYAGLLAAASGVILLFAFVIGLYAMRYSTSFSESEALKGSFVRSIRGVKLRSVLIVFQFAVAMALICISTLIRRQNDYMMNYDWGIAKDNILCFPLSGLGGNASTFGQELLRDTRIADYCILRDLPGQVGMSWGRDFKGKQIQLFVWSVDERFFDFFGIEIIAGRKPEYMDSVTSQMVLNETFLRKYAFDESIVGEDFSTFGPGRVAAIARDVNYHSLHEPVMPMAFGVLSRWNNFSHVLVKLSGNDLRGAIDQVKRTWEQFSREPFSVKFLDEEMNLLYQRENNMAKLIALFGIITVIIAVMGVYGMILFNARYKSREIAIRRVNGASIGQIIFMLNRSVLIQMGIAFVIATPAAYFVMQKWLDNFSYRTDISWWIFLFGGVAVLLITLLTVSVQSYRAASKNPAETLGREG
jgi:putative ABC transport system permease protein